MKQYYLFLLLSTILVPLFLQAQDFQELNQGFEESANDTWNYTATPDPYDIDEDAWTVSGLTDEISPATGGQFWYMRDLDNPNGGLEGFHTLDFDVVDVTNFPFNTIFFKYYTIDYELGDSIGYIVSTDMGQNFDMANYVDLDRDTEDWTQVVINIPAGATSVSLRLMAKQNGGSDYAGFDDINIFSGTIDVINPIVLGAEVLDGSTLRVRYNEPMNEASVESALNYDIVADIADIDYTDPGDGTSFVDITFVEPFEDGVPYTLEVSGVSDASGNFLLGEFTYDFVYNNSTPTLVITEIMYHPTDDDLEFIELYNAGGTVARTGGLTLNLGTGFALPTVNVNPGQTLLLARNEDDAEAFFGLDFYDWGDNALSNGGAELIITNFSGTVIDSVDYDDAAPWPTEPDGDGPSLELLSPVLDNALASSWRANPTQFMDTDVFATPGVISNELTPVVAFDEDLFEVAEGSGALSVSLSINNPNATASGVMVNIVSASTAVEGEDYTLDNLMVVFPANSTDAQLVGLDILDNDAVGGRYLLLELTSDFNADIGSNDLVKILIQDDDALVPAPLPDPYVQLAHLGSYDVGDGATAEIVAHHGPTQQLYVTNSEDNTLEIINYADPANLTAVSTVDLSVYGDEVNSVAVGGDLVAVAMQAEAVDGNGSVVLLTPSGTFLNSVEVGVLPDMVIFTPDGNTILTANEGEPDDDYEIDPEGTVSIIDVSSGAAAASVVTIGFEGFNDQQAVLVEAGIRIFGPGATVAQDMEPEYIAVSDDGTTAYVSCQENSAVAVVDLSIPAIVAIAPGGSKDWSVSGITFDASNRTDEIFFANWPVRSFYQPDAIDYFEVGGIGYLITANEGDARDYDGYSEEARVKDDEIVLDPTAFPDAEYLKEDELLGRLKITTANGDTDGDGDYDELYAYGGRSFSIWDAETGVQVYDSGNEIALITANDPVYGALFNSDDEENSFKNRSDDKGAEPESVVTAEIDGEQYAFIGLERIGGIMVYNITQPTTPRFLQYINTRTVDTEGGDLSPEGLTFIPASASPTGRPLLGVAYEVSGSIAMFDLDLDCPFLEPLPEEVTACKGDQVLLEVIGDYEFVEWSNGEAFPIIEVDSSGNYSVMATTSAGCIATDTSFVTFFDLPQIEIVATPEEACIGDMVSLSAMDGFEDYDWSTGSSDPAIIVNESGTYSLEVTDENGCEGSDEISLMLNALPIVDFPQDTTVCDTEPFAFDPGVGNVFIIDGEEVPFFSTEGFEPGSYTVDVTIQNELDCTLDTQLDFNIEVCGSTRQQLLRVQIALFPNPATHQVSVGLSQLEGTDYVLDILTGTGQAVQQHRFFTGRDHHQLELDVSQLPAGLYLIRLADQTGASRTQRLIVK